MKILNRHLFFLLGFAAFQTNALAFQQPSVSNQQVKLPSFTEAHLDFPQVETNLRKWDTPVVADLDNDGLVDLLLNDHGLGVSVRWNNNGKFSKTHDIIMGDLHGITVGDFDMDGQQDIIMSRGGGSGSNARNSKLFTVDDQRNIVSKSDFKEPLALMRGRTVKFFDGDNDGDLDLINFAFPDKVMKGRSENYIYENDGGGQLILNGKLPAVKTDGQKTTLTDFNDDGIYDLMLYGQGNIKAYQGNGDLTFDDVSDSVLPFAIEDVTGIVEFDFDNDGDFDLYLTRGLEFEKGETFYDASSKTLGFFTKRGKFNFDNIKVGDVLQLDNYHTQWPQTNQLYIGETGYAYEHDGETHSGKNLRLVNSDALGFPDSLSEKGIWIGYVGNQNWRIAGNVFGPLSSVVHGVESYESSNHPTGLSDLLLENKDGKFYDVTKKLNLFLEEHTTGAVAADVNNDGTSDLLVSRRGDLIHSNETLVFLNRKDKGFEQISAHGMVSKELGAIGLGIESLDYDDDGKMDFVLGNERGQWHLFRNSSMTESKYISYEVGTSKSESVSALGALVKLTVCGKKQVRRIGSSGAMYSQGYNPTVHFGIGTCNEKGILEIMWTNGENKKLEVTGN